MRPLIAAWVIFGLMAAGFRPAVAQRDVPAGPDPEPVVEHRVSFGDLNAQYVDVEMRTPSEGPVLELTMPNWTPGSYLIRDYAAQVERMRATARDGRTLSLRKVAKNRWRIDAGGEPEVIVSYAVWAGELAVHTSWVEPAFALLNGAGIFLFSESGRYRPQRLRVELPDAWKQVHIALPEASGGGYLATDYDELVDSPLLAGNAARYPFTVQDQAYALVNQGETDLWDGTAAARDASRIVGAVQDFWGSNPFDRPYLFLNVIADGTGGLEHDHSTVLLSGLWQMRDREDYVRWLSLLTHEFFHAWNIRRLRPRALVSYDYEREMYTRDLWLAEGLSSYYDNLLLFRSGTITVDEYFTLLAAEFHRYETTPGRRVRSAELASFDAWIKHYKPDPNSINSNISYYRKGALIGFVTDAIVRRETDHAESLDSVMRTLYRNFGPEGQQGAGYPPGAFAELIEQMAGAPARERVESLLSTTRDPDIDRALNWYGLQIDRHPSRTAAEAAGRPVPAGFGIIWDQEQPGLVVSAVVQGGSASAAGILPADELLAIAGTRVTRNNLADRLQRLRVDDTVVLTLVRHDRLLEIPVRVQHAIADKYLITIRSDISRREKTRLSRWLGVKLKFIEN
ncbi:M61 family metallopeptidase [Elongatibacter sediminis]|uniref:PDZ domain-containing protein n=1 Tax=Elongatibacter sediminis TaxID=3119006 RepID=A0AAW9RGD1_9GAMM